MYSPRIIVAMASISGLTVVSVARFGHVLVITVYSQSPRGVAIYAFPTFMTIVHRATII